MEKIVTDLVKIAEFFESNDQKELASRIDKISQGLVNVKTAQYVGVQGYAIRNSRCFSNCYRQKRTTNPKMAANDVWKECHKEYVASINNDGSKWDKYANGNKTTKTASVADEYVNVFKIRIANAIDEAVNNGQTHAFAINDTIENYEQILYRDIVSAIDSVEKIAAKTSNPKIAQSLTKLAKDMQKESQGFRDRFMNFFDPNSKGFRESRQRGREITTNIENAVATCRKAVENAVQALNTLNSEKARFTQTIMNIAPRTPAQRQQIEAAKQGMELLKLRIDPARVQNTWNQIERSILTGESFSNTRPNAAPAPAGSPAAAPAEAPAAAAGAPATAPTGESAPAAAASNFATNITSPNMQDTYNSATMYGGGMTNSPNSAMTGRQTVGPSKLDMYTGADMYGGGISTPQGPANVRNNANQFYQPPQNKNKNSPYYTASTKENLVNVKIATGSSIKL